MFVTLFISAVVRKIFNIFERFVTYFYNLKKNKEITCQFFSIYKYLGLAGTNKNNLII